ncbi:hypothetical protein HHI36_023664 [Cryptolaemus montrouzieri]|uniref:Uncharacterized protein n=1 Tax=Cryptolaemus montrouzieri TaxID=559131 RepID=A0ABD2PHY4_9CUCU
MVELKLNETLKLKKPTRKRRQAVTRSHYMNEDSDEYGLDQEGEEEDCAWIYYNDLYSRAKPDSVTNPRPFLDRLVSTLQTVREKCDKIILCGYFNEDYLKSSKKKLILSDLFDSSQLLGVDVEPTRVFTNSKRITTKSLIDYLVTDLKPECYVRDLLKIRISDHYGQLLSFTLASTNFKPPSNCTGRISTDYSLECLRDALEMFDWHVVYDLANDIDAAFNLFFAVFSSLFEECCPKSVVQ